MSSKINPPTVSAEAPVPLPPEADVSVRWGRLLLLTLALIILNTGWIANSEMKTTVTEITISTLFIGVTFILFLVTLVNLLVRRWSKAAALRQPEMMVLYAALSMSSVVAGVGHFGFFGRRAGLALWPQLVARLQPPES